MAPPDLCTHCNGNDRYLKNAARWCKEHTGWKPKLHYAAAWPLQVHSDSFEYRSPVPKTKEHRLPACVFASLSDDFRHSMMVAAESLIPADKWVEAQG